jgi:hypothetical protein
MSLLRQGTPLAKSRGVTSKALMVKAVVLLLDGQCEPVPASLRRRLASLGGQNLACGRAASAAMKRERIGRDRNNISVT